MARRRPPSDQQGRPRRSRTRPPDEHPWDTPERRVHCLGCTNYIPHERLVALQRDSGRVGRYPPRCQSCGLVWPRFLDVPPFPTPWRRPVDGYLDAATPGPAGRAPSNPAGYHPRVSRAPKHGACLLSPAVPDAYGRPGAPLPPTRVNGASGSRAQSPRPASAFLGRRPRPPAACCSSDPHSHRLVRAARA